jgi:hypothetical protein
MVMQQDTSPPPPPFRVRWPKFSGMSGWKTCVEAPRVEEGCLIIKTDPHRVLWVPLHTVLGPIEIEAV